MIVGITDANVLEGPQRVIGVRPLTTFRLFQRPTEGSLRISYEPLR